MPLRSILDSRPPSPNPTAKSRPLKRTPLREIRHVLRTHLLSAWVRLLIVYALAFGFFCLYGMANFYRDPGSIFFNEKYAYEQRYSQWRRRQADEFWKQTGQAVSKPADRESGTKEAVGKASKSSNMCLAFMTVQRKGLERQYIEVRRVTASLLRILLPNEHMLGSLFHELH